MGYSTQSGRWANTLDLTVLASAARGATVTGAAVEVGDRAQARLKLDVTAASGGSPTLDVSIETSHDGTTWAAIASFTQATGVTSQQKLFTGVDRFVRAVSTIGGSTPSFTYSVIGEAV